MQFNYKKQRTWLYNQLIINYNKPILNRCQPILNLKGQTARKSKKQKPQYIVDKNRLLCYNSNMLFYTTFSIFFENKYICTQDTYFLLRN